VIGTLYTPELIDDYVKRGLWDRTLTADNCDRNGKNYPEREAIIDSSCRLTWGKVSKLSDRLALGLLSLGLKKDDRILVQLPNCAELYLLIIAGEKAGITIVTVQPTFRHAELISIAGHVRAKAIVIPRQFRNLDYFEMVKDIEPQLSCLKHIITTGDEIPEGALSFRDLTPDDVEGKFPGDYLYQTRFKPYEITRIVTTSGTTGIPKCAEWSTCALMACGRALARRWELEASDVVGAFYNIIGGGLSIFSLYSVPIAGAKLVLHDRFTPEGFCKMVERERITIAAIVPAEVGRLLDYPDLEKYDLSSLRLLAHATTVLPYELAVRAEAKLGCRYVQTYGAMDVGPIASSSFSDPQDVRLKTVGRPYDGNEIRVVDDKGSPLPPGEVGEILVKGPTCCSGYYNNKVLNEQKWRDGWCDTTNQGWLTQDGNLAIMGRRRDVIIRGGQNIYPKEVEDLLLEHPKIREAAVVRIPDKIMGEKACAYVVPKPGQDVSFPEMVDFLKSRQIAPFKLPERLEVIEELPRVPAVGKVDVIRLEQDIVSKLEREGNG